MTMKFQYHVMSVTILLDFFFFVLLNDDESKLNETKLPSRFS